MLAYDFLKMIDTHTESSCDSHYFELLDNGLQTLSDHHENPDIVQVWFCSRLLSLTGRGINVETQVNGDPFDEDQTYNFDYEDMGFFAHTSGVFSPKHIKLLRLFLKVSKPANLLQIADSVELSRELKPLLTQCLRTIT
jgi:recombinational DNA repair protein (RecF pathway)